MGGDVDIHELIARLNDNERLRRSAHFSSGVYRSEPIVRTGRQMVNYLPDRYREMRAISRWQGSGKAQRGRWLTEAELFYRQARFMEDFEDDCPYQGAFSSYYPTYNAMSDRQLRGYFTWRAAVRAGEVAETSPAFACVYLYELINGIGVADARDGFDKIRSFWQAWRSIDTALDRNVRVWLHDYAIYHDLDPELLADDPVRKLDLDLIAVARALAPFDPDLSAWLGEDVVEAPDGGGAPRGRAAARGAAELPLPPRADIEERIFAAVDAHASYRLGSSRLYRERPDDLRHVACAVFVRMLGYYRRHRAHGLVEGSFGEEAEMGYTMFGSAVFFEEEPHPDADYELDPIHRYRCRRGLWTCRRVYGGQGRSSAWGEIARATDYRLRAALGFEPQLKEPKCPKYLARIIDREIEAWLSWKAAHAPRVIDIDLSKLSGIRSAAAETREALLVDEEREDGAAPEAPDVAPEGARPPEPAPARPHRRGDASGPSPVPAVSDAPADRAPASPAAPGTAAPQAPAGTGLEPEERAWLLALLDGTPAPVAAASEDLLVDTINEKLFDALGDTAVEFSEDGPRIVEDYRDDIRELIAP